MCFVKLRIQDARERILTFLTSVSQVK